MRWVLKYGEGMIERLGIHEIARPRRRIIQILTDRTEYKHNYYLRWRQNHQNVLRYNEHRQSYRLNLKREILIHYGGNPPKCAKCDFANERALTIDHIEGGGNEHRKQIAREASTDFYVWLKNNNYPLGFQVLCMNCQFMKTSED